MSKKTAKTLRKKITIVLREDKWGGGYLLKKSGKMCCLGMASSQLGASDEDMLNEGMPQAITYKDKHYPKVETFAHRCNKTPSEKLVALVEKMPRTKDIETYEIGIMLANVNDFYHRSKHKEQVKGKVVSIIRKGFEEMGYGLRFVPAKEARATKATGSKRVKRGSSGVSRTKAVSANRKRNKSASK